MAVLGQLPGDGRFADVERFEDAEPVPGVVGAADLGRRGVALAMARDVGQVRDLLNAAAHEGTVTRI